MRIYYKLDGEKKDIIGTWISGIKPEDMPKATIHTVPYGVLEIDEEYNPTAFDIHANNSKYYVDENGDIWEREGWIDPFQEGYG